MATRRVRGIGPGEVGEGKTLVEFAESVKRLYLNGCLSGRKIGSQVQSLEQCNETRVRSKRVKGRIHQVGPNRMVRDRSLEPTERLVRVPQPHVYDREIERWHIARRRARLERVEHRRRFRLPPGRRVPVGQQRQRA